MDDGKPITFVETCDLQLLFGLGVENEPTDEQDRLYRSLREKGLRDRDEEIAASFRNMPETMRGTATHYASRGGWRAGDMLSWAKQFPKMGQRVIRREATLAEPNEPLASSSWTGRLSATERLREMERLLPDAQAALQQLLDGKQIGEGHNGGPPLDEASDDEDPYVTLSRLHATLGVLLAEVESGKFDDGLGSGLAASSSRLAKKAARKLRHNPDEFAVILMVYAIFYALGFPFAGTLAGVIYEVTKNEK